MVMAGTARSTLRRVAAIEGGHPDALPWVTADDRLKSPLAGAAVKRALVTLFAIAGLAGPVLAHEAGDAYVQLAATTDGASLRIDVALRDLDAVLDIDPDGNGRLTGGEVRSSRPAIEAYVRSRVQVAGCEFQPAAHWLERRADVVHAALTANAPCVLTAVPAIHFTVLADVDPTHRGLVRIDLPDQRTRLQVLDPCWIRSDLPRCQVWRASVPSPTRPPSRVGSPLPRPPPSGNASNRSRLRRSSSRACDTSSAATTT